MIIAFIKGLDQGLGFSKMVERISNAMVFLDPADVGPWVYK